MGKVPNRSKDLNNTVEQGVSCPSRTRFSANQVHAYMKCNDDNELVQHSTSGEGAQKKTCSLKTMGLDA